MTLEEKVSVLHALSAVLKPEMDEIMKKAICSKILSIINSIVP